MKNLVSLNLAAALVASLLTASSSFAGIANAFTCTKTESSAQGESLSKVGVSVNGILSGSAVLKFFYKNFQTDESMSATFPLGEGNQIDTGTLFNGKEGSVHLFRSADDDKAKLIIETLPTLGLLAPKHDSIITGVVVSGLECVDEQTD